jgi:aminomethyltransferase
MAPDAGSLAGLHVLLTRPAGRGRTLVDELERRGARVSARPTIAIEPPGDREPVERAIREIARYTWIAFTSAHGVRAFFDSGASLRLPAVAAVGPATAQALSAHGVEPTIVADDPRGAGLAAALGRRLGPADRVLVVAPEARDPVLERELASSGAGIDVRAFYRTVPAPGIADLARDVLDGKFDLAIFTSPSTLARLVEAGTLAALQRMALVAIGPSTRRALEDLGLAAAAVAERPEDDALVLAVERVAASRVLASPTVSSPSEPKHTPLHDEHLRAGGRMVDFAHWHMPIQYAGVVEEHLAVRSRAGLFDVSHMGEVRVRGPQAVAFVQHVTSNDVAKLAPGRAHYTGLLTDSGGFVDDLLVYRLGEHELLLVINAANTAKDVAWLEEHARPFDVEVADESPAWSQLALQGPRAQSILGRSCRLDLAAIRYYHFVRGEVASVPCLVSRTGYTGEDGFELYAPADGGPHLWRTLLESGARDGLVPVGLGARDTLRLEAKMALYGNDIDDTTTPLEADLAWIVRLAKGDFVGRAALAAQQERGIERKLVGFEMTGRAIARHGYAVLHEGHEVARVTSGSHAPYLKKNIGLAYLPLALVEPGTRIEIDVRGRAEPAVVVPTPFYRRPSA